MENNSLAGSSEGKRLDILSDFNLLDVELEVIASVGDIGWKIAEVPEIGCLAIATLVQKIIRICLKSH